MSAWSYFHFPLKISVSVVPKNRLISKKRGYKENKALMKVIAIPRENSEES